MMKPATTVPKNVGLVRQSAVPMALEPRYMFDAAAVDTIVDHVAPVKPQVDVTLFTAPVANELTLQAMQKAQVDVKSFLSQQDAKSLFTLFSGQLGAPTAAWLASADALIQEILTDKITVKVETFSEGQLSGALGAFASNGPQGVPVIYLNQRLVQEATSSKDVERVLVEEFGHFIDARLNAASDTAGDEGQIFAEQVLGSIETSAYAATENDQSKLHLNDRVVDVELATAPVVSVSFMDGYIGIQGSNTNKANGIKLLSEMGISRIAFLQTDVNGDGLFGDGGTQGNDLAGALRITLSSGTVYTLNGALNWRETTGSTVEVFGFILDSGQNATWTFNSQTYNITGGTTSAVSSTVGLQAFTSDWTFVSGENRAGNAATSGLLSALNAYLALTPKPLTVTSSDIMEGQNVVFTVTLDSTTTTYFNYPLEWTWGTGITAADYSGSMLLAHNGPVGSSLVLNSDGTITVGPGISSFTVTYATVDDSEIESTESATLTIGAKAATALILDNDGVGVVVSSPTVNEASPYAVFTVAASVGQNLSLALTDVTATGSGTDYGTGLSYSLDGGTNWTTYTGAFNNALTGSGLTTGLLVRTAIINDGTPDNGETFTLTATPTGGTAVVGTATIKDDGTGTIYNADGTPNAEAVKNNDITVSSPTVNEASPYAVFTVAASVGQNLSLALTDVTATGSGTDYGTGLSYSLDGGTNWTTYTGAFNNALTGSGLTTGLLVRTAIINDGTPDNGETFTLTATPTGGTAVVGTATIKDDGTGTIYNANGTPNTEVIGDDDRPLSTDNIDVNEGSPYAVFTVRGAGHQLAKLALSNITSTGLIGIEYYDGNANSGDGRWIAYVPNTYVALNDAGKLFVRIALAPEQEGTLDTGEKFTLTASNSGGRFAVGTGTIFDDGTGLYFSDSKPSMNGPVIDISRPLDDDRPKPEPLPLPVLPAAPPNRMAEPPVLSPPAPQVFSSTLDPVAPRLVPIEPPRPMGDVLTSQSGYRIPANDAAAPGLSLNRGVTDQFVQGTQVATKISLPFDAFVHSDKDAVIKLEAKQADNRSLPKWVQFDPVSGVFEVTPPKGFKGKLDLKVVARDDDGREATALFQLFVGEQEKVSPQSRESFSEKLRMAGKRPITLIRVSDAQSKVTVRESMPQKVRAG